MRGARHAGPHQGALKCASQFHPLDMEDVLDLYHEDYDPDHPVVLFRRDVQATGGRQETVRAGFKPGHSQGWNRVDDL